MMTAFTYGLYSALIAIAVTLLEYFTGLDRSTSGRFVGFLGLVGMAVMIFLAIKARKQEDYGGRITYGQSVGTGTLVALFSSIVTAIFMFIYLSYINPDIIDFIVSESQKKMAEQHFTPEQLQSAGRMTRTFASPIAQSVTSLLGGTLIGLIISLIVGIFTRTKEEEDGIHAS